MHRTTRFRKNALSSCIATCTMAALGSAAIAQDFTDQEDTIDEIVVTGIRASQKAAIDVKRTSANIVDSIVAEDIGKLPDVTIADSLQRVTGVQIDRTAGEGSSLNVRGMPQVLTTLNGEIFLSPWSLTGVQANYSDIPASMISGVDVLKSQSATTIAGGISGVIDLKTRRALDLEEGWTGSVAVEGSEGSITKDTNSDVNGFVGWNNGSLGFTLGAFSSVTNSANYGMSGDSRLAFVGTGDPFDLNSDGNRTSDRYLVPGGYSVKANVMERQREGFAGSFQTDIGDTLTFTGEVFYTKMDQYDRGVEANFNSLGTVGIPDQCAEDPECEAVWQTSDGLSDLYNVLRPGSITQKEVTVAGTGGAPDRVLNSVQLAVIESPNFESITASLQNHTDAINSNFELAYDSGSAFTGTLRYVHAEAERLAEQATFKTGTPVWHFVDENNDGRDDPVDPFWVTVDYRSEYPTFSHSDDLASTDRLTLFQSFAEGQQDEATMDTLRADGSYEFELAVFKSIDFGVRAGSRDVKTTKFSYMSPTGRYPDYDSRVPADLHYELLPGDFVWERYGPWYDYDGNENFGLEPFDALKEQIITYTDFGPFKGFESGVAALDPERLDDVGGFLNTLYPGSQRFADPARAFSVVEDTLSAYLQANFETDNGLFSGNFGVQVVQTDREVETSVYPVTAVAPPGTYYGGAWQAAALDEPQGWALVYKTMGTATEEASFTDVLPSVNLNMFPHDDVVVRFSYNETMTRNDLTSIGEGEILWFQEYRVYTPDGPLTDAEGQRYKTVTGPGGGNDMGNPTIDPWRANNYNLSAEWYFAEGGLLNAGIFLIEVNSATEGLQEERRYPDSDGVVRRPVNIWTTQNVPASDLRGFEVGYKQSFDFLPGFLSNTGAELNYTYSDNNSGSEDLEGNSFPLQSNSEHQYNAVLWYQADKFSSRIAYNWRSDIYQGQVGLNTNEQSIKMGNWTEAAGYLDASINYDIIDNLSVYLQGTNLTETNYRNYAQFEDQFHSLAVQERRIAIGLRARI